MARFHHGVPNLYINIHVILTQSGEIMVYKLGRNARSFNTSVKLLQNVIPTLPTPPKEVDWSHGINNFGMMLNDRLGCCTCAAVYHAKQIWTANTLTEQTESDNQVLSLYEQACGYNPSNPSTDQGGNEQSVLTYLMNQGIPLDDGTRDKIIGFMEVNPSNLDDVKVTINEFGVAYIGFNVPKSLFANGAPASIWEVSKDLTLANSFDGGHAVVLVGYDDIGPTCISWGSKYKMTWEFFSRYTEEVYAIIDKSWIETNGKTPLDIDIGELEVIMSELKN